MAKCANVYLWQLNSVLQTIRSRFVTTRTTTQDSVSMVAREEASCTPAEMEGWHLGENVLNGLLLPRLSQLALFFAPGTFQTLQVAAGVKQVLSGLFSIEPTVLPSDAPVEVPRIIMQERGVGQLTLGYTRADLILEWRRDQNWRNRVTALSEELARYFVDQAELKVQRLGFVVTFAYSS